MTSVRRPAASQQGRVGSRPNGGQGQPRSFGDAVGDFVRRHGWRAYALPVLAVVTIVALFQGGSGPDRGFAPVAGTSDQASDRDPDDAAPTAPPDGQVKVDQPGANVLSAPQDSAALPPGGPYTEQGAGTFSVIRGATPVVGSGPLRRYSIEYEDGISGIDLEAMAATIDATLADPRSWTAGGQFSLQRVDSGDVDFRVTLVSSLTVRTLCGYEEQIETSCWAPDQEARVVLNNARWVRGSTAYANDLTTYRQYMVNHEVGHALGFGHDFDCRADGKAPLMMQQTKSVVDQHSVTCQPNPWPSP